MLSPAHHPGEAAPIIELDGVTKRFPGIIANDSVDLALRPGEVHVLLGENGAGKSTLIGMLSGLLQPDAGQIRIDGKVQSIGSPSQALGHGIGTVFQHAMLVPTLTVAENLLLGGPWWRRPNKEGLVEKVETLAQQLGMRIKLDALAADLSLGEQQMVEILRALLRGSRVLILDESTSMLSPAGVEELGALMRRLVERGMALVFITHKLREATAFGDRISVLKLGRKVGEIEPGRFRELDEDTLMAEIVEMMFGIRSDDPESVAQVPGPVDDTIAPLFSVRDLALPAGPNAPGLSEISFDVRPGEILGIAGIDGNGQKQLAEALAGQRADAEGSITLDGAAIDGLTVGGRRARGLRYLTDDRLGEGTVGSFPVAINFFIKEVGAPPYWKGAFERGAAIDQRAAELIKDYDVRTPSRQTPIGQLSGGNVQKVVLARELAEGARVVIYNKPTYGLDLNNTLSIRQRIREVAAQGKAVILISTELEEVLGLANRIAVMAEGRITGFVDNGPDARMNVGRLMIGISQ
ncbi:putative B6 ABC transporter ATP-binding protein [Pseudohoeflea coraliihabitans]|uniref:ABC transporter ATP-binding protein n=1 Tax=Pseudohoeflea coraliihabitans TaxID=2860393 RepID=A0ABS6WT98_9HYPH|nr:ABC transporter ATP-binding protein [Pseudohoeflea sp. DP4N28-3]MBW3098279.1 ABC transporter ATP-binding protein [Pseudohoeflea sp. DP4N28-3]